MRTKYRLYRGYFYADGDYGRSVVKGGLSKVAAHRSAAPSRK